MKEVLITSSVLIAAILILRLVFKDVLSCRVRYALWALALVRLLVPVSLPAAGFSVLTATEPVRAAVDQRLDGWVYLSPIERYPAAAYGEVLDEIPAAGDNGTMTKLDAVPSDGGDDVQGDPSYLVEDRDGETITWYAARMDASEMLSLLWKVGMAGMAVFFLTSNLTFYLRLRRRRTPYPVEGHARPIYLLPEGTIPSPCLFGRSIYLTPAVADDPEKLRHVLLHEETHARHLDPLWTFLRCVCLTVYWFDPLVWAAARCSGTDCELACDESALERLGDEERVGYGQTLLSLIPVKRAADPLLSATSMTAGKKQLKDRVTRIAKKPRRLAAVTVTVALLAAVVSACTFTGGRTAQTSAPENAGTRSLTAGELRFFNEEFFNAPGRGLANQLANPLNLYDAPEDVDLAELFYCGTYPEEPVSEDERALVAEQFGGDPGVDVSKTSAAAMDAVLTQYLGRTRAQTGQMGLNSLLYLSETDAYYSIHGDTNYPGDIEFLYGAWEGGAVKLYHHAWYCTTLERQADGSYHFLSNVKCDRPAIPVLLPDREPEAVIPLAGLAQRAYPTVTARDDPGPGASGDANLVDWRVEGLHLCVYRGEDGAIRAAWEENGVYRVFLDHLPEDTKLNFFVDLFGHDGFYVDYSGQYDEHSFGPLRDYYYFTDNETPVLLARCETHADGEPMILDLNGDGTNELASPRQIFFEKDGLVYEARVDTLLLQDNKELNYVDTARWDRYARCLIVTGYNEAQWTRHIYFDGDLLVYKPEVSHTDHMVDGAANGVPGAVVDQAMAYVERQLEKQSDGAYLDANWRELDEGWRPVYDDWRTQSFHGPYDYAFGDVTVRGWGFNYECHTTTPDKVVLAGGRYRTEDDWVSPGYPGCDYLFFRVENGTYTFLWHEMNNDMSPDSLRFRQHIEEKLSALGVDIGGRAAADGVGGGVGTG